MEPAVKAALITGAATLVAALIGVVVTLIRRRQTGRAPPPAALPPEPSHSIAPGFIREETAAEILKTLEAVPPLQRNAVWKGQYEGRRVRWSGTVSHIGDKHGLSLLVSQRRDLAGAAFAVKMPESERVAIEPMREGDNVTVEGRLDEILGEMVFLKDARVVSHEKK